MKTRGLLFLFMAGAVLAATAAAGSVYVTIDTSLKDKKGLGAQTIAELKQGAVLELLDNTPPQYQVRTSDGKTGYVHMSKVSENKPDNIAGELASAGTNVELNSEKSSYAIRGLGPKAEQYAQSKGISQASRDAVDRVQALRDKLTPDVEPFVAKLEIGSDN